MAISADRTGADYPWANATKMAAAMQQTMSRVCRFACFVVIAIVVYLKVFL